MANWRQVGTSWAYVQLDMSPKVVAVCFQGRRSRRVRSRFVCRSREISLVSSLHRASTDTLIGTMKVSHYTHTFEKLTFSFNQSPLLIRQVGMVTRSKNL